MNNLYDAPVSHLLHTYVSSVHYDLQHACRTKVHVRLRSTRLSIIFPAGRLHATYTFDHFSPAESLYLRTVVTKA